MYSVFLHLDYDFCRHCGQLKLLKTCQGCTSSGSSGSSGLPYGAHSVFFSTEAGVTDLLTLLAVRTTPPAMRCTES